MQKNIVVSFSGGRTSAYMLRRLLDEYHTENIAVVFANTGKERTETLDFVNECSVRWNVPITWIEAHVTPEKGKGTTYRVTDYVNADRHGSTFVNVIRKYGVPSPSFPHCSRELKIVPIQKWAVDTFGAGNYEMAVGMRYDELERMGEQWYPLIEWKITKPIVRQFWKNQPFDLKLSDYEGNCDLCWKKSLNKKLTLIEQRPESVEWWQRVEEKYGNGYIMGRGYVTYSKMRELVQRGKFRRVQDEESNKVLDLFGTELNCTCGVDL